MNLLTVVIPAYGRQELLLRAVKSVLDQDELCDLIIVDDGSPTAIVLPKSILLNKQVSMVRHAENGGVSKARNTGINAATTPLVTFLDSDDYWLPRTLASRIDFARKQGIEENPLISVGCGWHELNQDGMVTRSRIPNSPKSQDDFFKGCWFCPGSAVIFNRSVFLSKIGLFEEPMRRLEDFEWFMRFAMAGGNFIAQNLIGAAIQLHRQKPGQDIDYAMKALETQFGQMAHQGSVSKTQFRLMKAYLSLEKARYAYDNGNYGITALHLIKSFLKGPRMGLHLSPGWHD